MKRRRKWQRGFVTNELPIVLSIFCLFCLVLAVSIGGAFKLAWYWRVLVGLGFIDLGLGWFFAYVFIDDKRQKRAAQAEARHKEQPPDGGSAEH